MDTGRIPWTRWAGLLVFFLTLYATFRWGIANGAMMHERDVDRVGVVQQVDGCRPGFLTNQVCEAQVQWTGGGAEQRRVQGNHAVVAGEQVRELTTRNMHGTSRTWVLPRSHPLEGSVVPWLLWFGLWLLLALGQALLTGRRRVRATAGPPPAG